VSGKLAGVVYKVGVVMYVLQLLQVCTAETQARTSR